MIFLCYMTSIINATNTHGSEPRIDKNTGDNDDNINSGSKAVPAGLTQNSSNKLQGADMSVNEDRLVGVKHSLPQKNEQKMQDKVFVIDANGNVRDVRYKNKPADADNIGSDARPAELDNESEDENKAKETTVIDGKTPASNTDELHTQQMHEENIKHNQSLYKGYLKQRYDVFQALLGMKNIFVENALKKFLTWEEYQNLMICLKYYIDSSRGPYLNNPEYLAEWYKQGICQSDTLYTNGVEPSDKNYLLVTDDSTTTENKPMETKTITENNDGKQVKAKGSDSDNPNTHNQMVARVELGKMANTTEEKMINANKPEAKNTESTTKTGDVCNEKAVTSGATAVEKIGSKDEPNTEVKNDILQPILDTKLTNNPDVEKQENTGNTQKTDISEEKKHSNNLANWQSDANKLKQEIFEYEAKNKAGIKENKTEDMSIYKPIKHYSATKSRQPVTVNTTPEKNDKNTYEAKSSPAYMKQPVTKNTKPMKDDTNKNIAKHKAANKKSGTTKENDKSFYQRNKMIIMIMIIVVVFAIILSGIFFYFLRKSENYE